MKFNIKIALWLWAAIGISLLANRYLLKGNLTKKEFTAVCKYGINDQWQPNGKAVRIHPGHSSELDHTKPVGILKVYWSPSECIYIGYQGSTSDLHSFKTDQITDYSISGYWDEIE